MRLALVASWILIAGSVSGGVYWVFLNTPESTVWTLIASALLALGFIAATGLTVAGAIAIWSNGVTRSALTRALRSIPAIIPAMAIVAIGWWMTTRVEAWVAMRSGQISAWFIAQFGWGDVAWLFRTVTYGVLWLQWVVAPLLAVSLMNGVMAIGGRAVIHVAWLRRALRPRAVLVATFWFVVLIAIPWRYVVPWRPASLPPTTVELAFIVGKLSLSAILFAIGAALFIRQAIGNLPPSGDPKEFAQAA